MLRTRSERAEQLRSSAQEAAASRCATELVDLAAGDTAAVQTAWSSFAPFLAHPVIADQAGGAMALLDRTAVAVAARHPVTA